MSDRDTVNDVTAALIKDASNGYGPSVRRFAAAAPAKPGKLTKAQQAALFKYDGALLGYTSKALIYDELVRYTSAAERRALANLLKGGLLVAERVNGPIEGAPYSRIGGHGPWHYVLRAV